MHHNLTPAQLENLPETPMSENTVPSHNPPSASEFQKKLLTADTPNKEIALLAEWAMKTGLCNNIPHEVYDKLLLRRRGVIA